MDPVDMHRRHRGKIETRPKVKVDGYLHVWYTPGVAEVSRRVAEDPEESFELTWRGNVVAVVSDGTRVLGLGDIGPEAALPVMEGKALLFKYYGGVDAVPIVIREKDPDRMVELVKALEPSFGGINLEDIATPKCFYVLDRLRREMNIPVFHDDQQGTATVTLAALLNAAKVVNKNIRAMKIVLFGAGAANTAFFRLLLSYGVSKDHIVVIDSKGVIGPHRKDVVGTYKEELVHPSIESLEEAFEGADAVIAASRPGPGVIGEDLLRRASEDLILFALANPVPEVDPDTARRLGVAVYATGRSDLPNQVNNVLAFPAIFRGALTVRARKITDGMILRAAETIAEYSERYLPDRIIAPPSDRDLYRYEALAVAEEAIREGVARRPMDRDTLAEEISRYI